MHFWKGPLPLLFLAKVDLKQGKVGCLGTGTSVAKQGEFRSLTYSSIYFLYCRFIIYQKGIRVIQISDYLNSSYSSTCILHFFTVLTNTVQNAQSNENSFLSFLKANDPCMICSCCINYEKNLFAYDFSKLLQKQNHLNVDSVSVPKRTAPKESQPLNHLKMPL